MKARSNSSKHDHGNPSLWSASVSGDVKHRPPIVGNCQVDVAIIGGGYTGLWTAYYLATLDPSLRIVILEKERVGFGASGRNGGRCCMFPVSYRRFARSTGTVEAVAMQRALFDAVDEIGRVTKLENVDINYTKGGALIVANSPAQAKRVQAIIADAHASGFGEQDLRWLESSEAALEVNVNHCFGAAYTPHCASIHPAKLVRALVEIVERRGVAVHEGTPALATSSGHVRVPGGEVIADVIVRGTEAYTPTLSADRRALAPLYSFMIATEPLSPAFWNTVRWHSGQLLQDAGHLAVYAQRTTDGRIALGGGSAYHLGSRITTSFDQSRRISRKLSKRLTDLFPEASGAAITHHWGGPIGVPCEGVGSVGFDRSLAVAWGGGYIGDGAVESNLAARTIAFLILGYDVELTRLAWVNRQMRAWVPEPARWLAINSGIRLATALDQIELRSRPDRAKLFRTLVCI
jgi:glycine/D-amino acid oxidase-like deaminating enzyme